MTLGDLDLFYGKFKYGHIGFSMGKVESLDLPESFAALDLKVGGYIHVQHIELMKLYEC